MSGFKAIWGTCFRLFPCPTSIGLRRIGSPDRMSPVLVTCNFDLTVKRLRRILEGASIDAWLVVADSKGVNVYCAAGGDEFNAQTVVAAVKTCGVADEVDHRRLILPPLGAPGIRSDEVRTRTGWSTRWGPMYAEDLPRFLSSGRRDESMKRARYDWRQRLDTGFGSLFPFYFLGALGIAATRRGMLPRYLSVAALTFVFFMISCLRLPGRHGLTKVLFTNLAIGVAVAVSEAALGRQSQAVRSNAIVAMISLMFYGTELGGLASTLPSDLDPAMAKLGIGAVGNVKWADTIRTELLMGRRELEFDRDLCNGCRRCFELCPVRVWEMEETKPKRAIRADRDKCTACRACLVQCPTGAVQAVLTPSGRAAASRSPT